MRLEETKNPNGEIIFPKERLNLNNNLDSQERNLLKIFQFMANRFYPKTGLNVDPALNQKLLQNQTKPSVQNQTSRNHNNGDDPGDEGSSSTVSNGGCACLLFILFCFVYVYAVKVELQNLRCLNGTADAQDGCRPVNFEFYCGFFFLGAAVITPCVLPLFFCISLVFDRRDPCVPREVLNEGKRLFKSQQTEFKKLREIDNETHLNAGGIIFCEQLMKGQKKTVLGGVANFRELGENLRMIVYSYITYPKEFYFGKICSFIVKHLNNPGYISLEAYTVGDEENSTQVVIPIEWKTVKDKKHFLDSMKHLKGNPEAFYLEIVKSYIKDIDAVPKEMRDLGKLGDREGWFYWLRFWWDWKCLKEKENKSSENKQHTILNFNQPLKNNELKTDYTPPCSLTEVSMGGGTHWSEYVKERGC
jgi:hypothetical protein